jgi:hypothetical protein
MQGLNIYYQQDKTQSHQNITVKYDYGVTHQFTIADNNPDTCTV